MDEQPDTGRFLREFVSGRDVPCPTCSYNLRDLTSAVCPECGEALAVRLQAEHPRVSVLVLGLLPLAMALGFFAMGTLIIVGVSLYFGDWPPIEFWITLPFCAAICLAATVAWLKAWRKIRRWPDGLRSVAIVACWVFLVASVAVAVAILVNS